MKRATMESRAAVASCGCPDAEFARMYPTIAAYLSDDRWDDGKPRELSSLTVSIVGGLLQLALNDKARGCSCYSSAPSLGEALALLDNAVLEERVQWRVWKQGGEKRK